MAQVVWTARARTAARQVHQYLASESPAAANRLLIRLRDAAARLADYPEMGRMVPEYADPTVREVIVGQYRLMYRVLAARGRVRIFAVVHGSRRLPPLDDLQ